MIVGGAAGLERGRRRITLQGLPPLLQSARLGSYVVNQQRTGLAYVKAKVFATLCTGLPCKSASLRKRRLRAILTARCSSQQYTLAKEEGMPCH